MQAEQNINQGSFAAWQDKSIPGNIPLGTRLFCHNIAMAVKRHLRPLPEPAVCGRWHRPTGSVTSSSQLRAGFIQGDYTGVKTDAAGRTPGVGHFGGTWGKKRARCCPFPLFGAAGAGAKVKARLVHPREGTHAAGLDRGGLAMGERRGH